MDESRPEDERAAIQAFFLRRLEHILEVRHRYGNHLNREGQWLIAAATFSTFYDCRDIGVGEAAVRLLQRELDAETSETSPAPTLPDPS